jgi:hypothetical protein
MANDDDPMHEAWLAGRHGAVDAAKQPIVRQMTEGISEVIERLGSGPMTSCRVNLIALDAVALAFGDRWSAKSVQVHEHVQRILDRNLKECGYFLRVSETDFLVVQSELSEFAAQAICCRSFDEIWTHFLGQLPQTAYAVHRVTDLAAGQITAVEVNPNEALAGDAQERAEARRIAADQCQGTGSSGPQRHVPFVASNGRVIDVTCRLEPVFNLKTYGRIALRLDRSIVDLASRQPLSHQEIAGLSRSDTCRIDIATMSRGLSRLQEQVDARPELSLIVPASYIALSHAPSRQAFITAIKDLQPWTQKGLILEIRDLAGAPHAGLAQVIAILKPFCLLVVGHFNESPDRSLKGVGLQALSVSCPSSIEGDASFIGWLKPWLRAAQPMARSVMVYRCVSTRRMAVASLLGATHASSLPVTGTTFGGSKESPEGQC